LNPKLMPPDAADGGFRVTFHGVRGSHSVSGPQFLRFGGHTSCVSVSAGGWLILLDLGTGVIELGNALVAGRSAPRPVVALISHTHRDHLAGFSFFKPAYRAGWKLELYGPKVRGREFGDLLHQYMDSPWFPVQMGELPAAIRPATFRFDQSLHLTAGGDSAWRPPGEPAAPGGVKITALDNPAHPKDGVINYCLEHAGRRLIYATDTESLPDLSAPLAGFARGADLLIHDAQYSPSQYHCPDDPTCGYGHSTWEMACDLARRAEPKSLVLFHHDPNHADADLEAIEQSAAARFPGTRLAREGMVIEL
jgi:ribonuclease BN (tRNA processing enzyme)